MLHHFLELIPFPGVSWNEVLTTHPAFYHFQWSLLFAMSMGLIHCVTIWLSRTVGLKFMHQTKAPDLPDDLKAKKECYLSLNHYQQMHNADPKLLTQYDLHQLSTTYTAGQLSEKEVHRWLRACSRHHHEVEANARRFRECLFPIFTKGFSLWFGVSAFYQKTWVYDRSMFYKGWPYDQGLDCCVPDMKFLYMFHVGWYTWKLYAQLFVDRKLKDFVPSMIHHFCAMGLLALSYYAGTMRGGTVVLILHDPADVVLSTGKLFRLIHQPLLLNVTFALLVVVWFTTRIVLFPYSPMMSAWVDFYEHHGGKNSSDDFVIMTCCLLMSALWVLHLHWFWLICQAACKTLHGVKEIRDSRSDFEDEKEKEEEEEEPRKEEVPLLKGVAAANEEEKRGKQQ